MLLFYIAVYLSAFLLFLIQPMLTKALLPTFGGSYLVWGAAMVFFQGTLLLGYVLSHAFQVKWGVRRYGLLHLFVLLLPFLMFPFALNGELTVWEHNLAMGVFRQLLLTAGGPFLVLSMTSLILQRWLMVSPMPQRKNPYVLYAASNAGSVSALLAYPLLIEPVSTLAQQASIWWLGYLVLVLLHWCIYPWRAVEEITLPRQEPVDEGWGQCLRWFLLSLATGTMLLATTNVITFDLAAIPLLWVLPLALFMLAYVVVFKRVLWCPVWIQQALNWSVMLGACLVLLLRLRVMLPPVIMLLLYFVILFVVCINCNLLLLQSSPASGTGLTTFYVVLAFGGLCGSVLVSWVLPLLSQSLAEYPLALVITVVAVGLCKQTGQCWGYFFPHVFSVLIFGALLFVVPRVMPGGYPESIVFVLVALPLALSFRLGKDYPVIMVSILLLVMVGSAQLDQFASGGKMVARLRNYYGIYTIYDRDNIRYLQHGTTQHGRQYLDPLRSSTPLAYYHPTTPAARVLRSEGHRLQQIGMIGLGTGAFTAYGQTGQQWSIFELDPDNLALAEQYFRYLEHGRRQGAAYRFVFGDGRMRIAQEPNDIFDLLILDAFNSGAIPVHLLTTEALAGYMKKLRPDGVLLLHLSNRMLDLVPVVYANAVAVGVHALVQSNEGEVHPDSELTIWMALSADAKRMDTYQLDYGWRDERPERLPRPWTDQYSNLPAAIRWL